MIDQPAASKYRKCLSQHARVDHKYVEKDLYDCVDPPHSVKEIYMRQIRKRIG